MNKRIEIYKLLPDKCKIDRAIPKEAYVQSYPEARQSKMYMTKDVFTDQDLMSIEDDFWFGESEKY